MPAIAHLQARFLEDASGNGGISATAIALVVCLGIVPCIILIWAVCYLFWAYPYDRNCCCIKRKRRPEPQSVLNQAPMSEETLHEKPGVAPPQRPFSAQIRTESGTSSNNGRLQKQQRPGSGVDTRATRMSLQSVISANTITYAQEPKPFFPTNDYSHEDRYARFARRNHDGRSHNQPATALPVYHRHAKMAYF